MKKVTKGLKKVTKGSQFVTNGHFVSNGYGYKLAGETISTLHRVSSLEDSMWLGPFHTKVWIDKAGQSSGCAYETQTGQGNGFCFTEYTFGGLKQYK